MVNGFEKYRKCRRFVEDDDWIKFEQIGVEKININKVDKLNITAAPNEKEKARPIIIH